jgi:hypothetical protein
MQSPHGRWMPPSERYQYLAKRAWELDPRTIVGVGSPTEIARMEKVAEQLEKAALAAKEKEANGPVGRAQAALSGLYRRAEQAELKVRGDRELAILLTPGDLEAPAPIGRASHAPFVGCLKCFL